MPRPALRLTLVPLLLAACVETTPPPRPMPPAPAPGICNEAAFRQLIGQNRAVLASMGLQGPVRIIGPDTAVTADYQPNRLNIVYDRRDIIVDVGCY